MYGFIIFNQSYFAEICFFTRKERFYSFPKSFLICDILFIKVATILPFWFPYKVYMVVTLFVKILSVFRAFVSKKLISQSSPFHVAFKRSLFMKGKWFPRISFLLRVTCLLRVFSQISRNLFNLLNWNDSLYSSKTGSYLYNLLENNLQFL